MSTAPVLNKPSPANVIGHAGEVPAAQRLLSVVPLAVLFILLVWVWGSVVWHYHVRGVTVGDAALEMARVSPADSVFDQLRELSVVVPFWSTDAEVVRHADRLLNGEIIRIQGEPMSLRLALSPAEMGKGSTGTKLVLACMDPVRILLRAYETTGNIAYLSQARNIILAFDSWDKQAWIPVGLAWNHHAVTSRAQVLTDFWGLYRHSTIYDPGDARRMLELLGRTGRRLSGDRYFVVGTNHGVMQNVALLELAIAFPSLPETGSYRDLAVRRLNTQFTFALSDEGAILEHSAFYHHFTLRLLSVAWRMLEMLNEPVPDQWRKRYELAKTFDRELQRPDGTFPQYGDTFGKPDLSNADVFIEPGAPLRPAESWVLYPVSGYSVSWSGLEEWPKADRLSQTVVTWSNFPSHTHKHADDLSVLVWAGGQSWWTNVGYWPYGDAGRAAGESWNASNAPHLAAERFASKSGGRLLAAGSSGSLRFLDLERKASGEVTLRRQIVEVQPSRWVVIDNTTASGDQQVVTSWNAAATISVQDERNGCYFLASPEPAQTMETCIIAGTRLKSDWLRGSMKPFAGWQVVDHSPVPANALLVQQSTGSWSVNAFRLLHGREQSSQPPEMRGWQGAQRWTLNLGPGEILSRDEDVIRWSDAHGRTASLTLSAPSSEVAARSKAIRQAYFEAIRRYPTFEDAYGTRVKITLLLCGAYLLATIASLAAARRVRGYAYVGRILVAVAWVVGAITLIVRFDRIF